MIDEQDRRMEDAEAVLGDVKRGLHEHVRAGEATEELGGQLAGLRAEVNQIAQGWVIYYHLTLKNKDKSRVGEVCW